MSDKSRQEIVEFMLRQFRPERYVYLAVTLISFILLIICVVSLMIRQGVNEQNLGYLAGLLGSGGAISYTASQLLRMWRDCMALFMKDTQARKDEDSN